MDYGPSQVKGGHLCIRLVLGMMFVVYDVNDKAGQNWCVSACVSVPVLCVRVKK